MLTDNHLRFNGYFLLDFDIMDLFQKILNIPIDEFGYSNLVIESLHACLLNKNNTFITA